MNISINSEAKTIIIEEANLAEFFELIYGLNLDLSEWKIVSSVVEKEVQIPWYTPNIPCTPNSPLPSPYTWPPTTETYGPLKIWYYC